MKPETCNLYCEDQFERNFDTEYNSFWDAKAQQSEYGAFFVESVQGTGGYMIPPKGYYPRLKQTLAGALVSVEKGLIRIAPAPARRRRKN